jgi:glycosyltransferase involved in cell wall biosynthesis
MEHNVSTHTLSLVVPVYNEAAHLERWCEEIFAFDFTLPTEFVFVDDASTDGTVDILKKFTKRSNVKLLQQSRNQGKGAALARGLATTTGSIVIVQDADFEYSFQDVPAVIQPIVEDKADIVFGSRYKNSFLVHRTFHYAINRVLTIASNVASGLYVTDMETCYKAFRGEIIRGITIESPRFGFEPEVTAKIARLKVRVAEVPVRYFPRNYLEGKKIRWQDGIAAMWHIARFNSQPQRTHRMLAGVPEKFRIHTRQWL